MSQTWVILTYKIPSQPSASRVAVWRKLKRLGAILLHDAAWVLPATARTREHFQWLASEIRELGGEACLWEGAGLLHGQEQALASQFLAQVEPGYRQIMATLERPKADLVALARRYQQLLAQDHCRSPLGEQVRAALISAREGAPL